jgi:hypothetical protein
VYDICTAKIKDNTSRYQHTPRLDTVRHYIHLPMLQDQIIVDGANLLT